MTRRFGLDVSKLADSDGIGQTTRQLLIALRPLLDDDEELWLYAPLPGRDGPLTAADVERLAGAPGTHERFRGAADPAGDELTCYHATSWVQPTGLVAPTLFSCYDLTVLDHPECHTLGNRLHCLEGLLAARLAGAHFLAISRGTADRLAHWFEVPAEELSVVYPAPAEDFEPLSDDAAREHLRRRFGLDAAPVLAVGTLEPRKNLARLVEAWGRLDPELRRAHPLVLAGSPGWHDAAAFDRLLAEPQHTGVHRLGWVESEDLVALYSAAAIFAYPSLGEGFGLPIVEAMACGAPVITSAGGATEETAGGAARLVDPLDSGSITSALEALLTDPAARQDLRDRGLERAHAFSWQNTARHTLDLYRRLAGTPFP